MCSFINQNSHFGHQGILYSLLFRIAFFPPHGDKGFANRQSVGLVTLKLLDKSVLEGAIVLVARAHQNLSGATKNLTWLLLLEFVVQ